MNKLNLLSFSLLFLLIRCNAQQVQTRTVSPFEKIEVAGSVSVFYTHSDTLDVSVKAKSSELEHVETHVENSTLMISNKGKFTGPISVYVKNNHLISLEASGATDFRSMNSIKVDSMDINVSGSANVNLKIDAKKITNQQSGASTVVLKGTANELNTEVTGASSLKAYSLVVKNAHVTSTGAATAKVYVTETLKANATGASDIKIKGEPREVAAESGNSASISRIKEHAQSEEGTENDTTYYNLKHKKIIVIDGFGMEEHEIDVERKFKHWTGFSMGVNGYLTNTGSMTMPKSTEFMDLNYSKSFNYQFNLFEKQFNLISNKMKIVTGFGFDYHLYEFSNKTTLNPDTSYTWGTIDTDSKLAYHKNKLRCTYIQVPLLLEFNTSNDPLKTFHIAVGVVGQFLIASRTKQVLEDEKDEYTKVRKDGYNLTPFAAKAHVNLGYRGWTVFGEYSVTSLFQPGKGPELYPFSMGIRLIPFS
ncbi:MAG: DUF2807 domain-containing protein [bacterium]|nr:DUF2807 domain-containing protein [bacterium]